MTDKLKPCHFCGVQLENEQPSTIWSHPNNGCLLSLIGIEEGRFLEWNTRKPMDRIVEQLEEKKTKFSFPKHCKSIGVCPSDKTCSECIVDKFVEDIIAIVKGVQNE